MDSLDKASMWTGIIENSVMTALLVATLIYIRKKFKLKFIEFLIGLMILSDVASVCLSIGLGLEQNPEYVEKHAHSLGICIGMSTFFFNLGTNIMHWEFGFEYWVISVEVPRLLNGQTPKAGQERFYKILNAIIVTINLLACAFVATVRGMLTASLKPNEPANPTIVEYVKYSYNSITVLQLISCFTLFDALRRIKSQLSSNPQMIPNKKMLYTHIGNVFVYAVLFSVCQFFIFRAFVYPTPEHMIQQNWGRIVTWLVSCQWQVVLIYVFIDFAKPKDNLKENSESIIDQGEDAELIDNSRQDEFEDLNFLYYLKNTQIKMTGKPEEYDPDNHKSGNIFLDKDDGSFVSSNSAVSQHTRDRSSLFANDVKSGWGAEESVLRQKIFCSFLDNKTFNKLPLQRESDQFKASITSLNIDSDETEELDKISKRKKTYKPLQQVSLNDSEHRIFDQPVKTQIVFEEEPNQFDKLFNTTEQKRGFSSNMYDNQLVVQVTAESLIPNNTEELVGLKASYLEDKSSSDSGKGSEEFSSDSAEGSSRRVSSTQKQTL